MKKIILPIITLVLMSSSILEARTLSPTLSIRYNDFINDLTPQTAIGLNLKIDDDRYTGFEVDSDGNDYRMIVGFKWGIIGLGTVTSGDDVLAQYTFGVSYEVVENLSSNFEYVMTPDLPDGNDNLRLALSITF
tara:strand:- start:79 stop:480 length:402 start_codon:yes stop_codon:yes gene_type:complete